MLLVRKSVFLDRWLFNYLMALETPKTAKKITEVLDVDFDEIFEIEDWGG